MKLILTFMITFFFLNCSFGIELIKLTEDDLRSSKEREKLINNKNNKGIRLAYIDMKKMNKEYKPDKVDQSIKEFEEKMVQILKGNGPKDIKIFKSDFKGYYITCKPIATCFEPLKKAVQNLPAAQIGNGQNFYLKSSAAKNYVEGYLKVRANSAYGIDLEGDKLKTFIQKELNASLQEASKVPQNEIRDLLAETVAAKRAGKKLSSEQQKVERLAYALDNLLETPFEDSHDLQGELKNAISTNIRSEKGKFKVVKAHSGDDLFVVIKDHRGHVVRVIGADARGLAVTNALSRYDELSAFKGDLHFDSLEEIKTLSNQATTKANKKVLSVSMDKYVGLIKEAINKEGIHSKNLNYALKKAHQDYHILSEKNVGFIEMRTASIPACSPTPDCIQSEVTKIHNLLKKMEAKGKTGHFGDSCLGVQYWLRKY